MVKRILSIVIACAMVLGTVAFAVTDSTGAEVTYEMYDFSNDANGATTNSGNSSASSGPSGFYRMYSAEGKIVNSNGESYIHYHRTADGGGSRIMRAFDNTFQKTTASSKVRLSFKARTTAHGDTPSTTGEIQFGKLNSDKSNLESSIIIKPSASSVILGENNNGFVFADSKACSSYNDGKWHEYEFIFDFNCPNNGLNQTTNGTFYFNFDGNAVKNSGGRTAFLLSDTFIIDGIVFTNSTLGDGWDIDDIRITNSPDTTPSVVEMANDNGTVTLKANNSTQIKYASADTPENAIAAFKNGASVYSDALKYETGTYYIATKAYNGAVDSPLEVFTVKVKYSGVELYDFSNDTNNANLSNNLNTSLSNGVKSGFISVNTGSGIASIYNVGDEAYINIYNSSNTDTVTNRVGKTFSKAYASGSRLSFWINTSDSLLKKMRFMGTGLDVWVELTPDSFKVGSTTATSVPVYNDGKWHEFAFDFMFAESKINVYFDGQYICRETVPSTADFSQFQIGSAAGGTLLLDDVQMSDKISGVPEVVKVTNDYGNITLNGGTGEGISIKYYNAPSYAEAKSGFADSAVEYTGEFAIENGSYLAVQAYNNDPNMNLESPFKVWGPFATNRIVIELIEESELAPITVPYGTALSKLGLPATVTGYYNGDNMDEIQIPIEWSSEGYNKNQAGQYTLTGTLNIPTGYQYAERTVSITVTVEEDTVTENLVENISVRKNVGALSPISTGGLSQTDTLQLGYGEGVISITSEEFANPEYIADSTAVDNVGNKLTVSDEGAVDICFNAGYDGERTLKDIKLLFTKVDNNAKYDIELLYKTSESGEWVRFWRDATDFAVWNDGASSSYGEGFKFTNAVYPAVILSDFNGQISNVYAMRIKINNNGVGTVLCEADINMTNDGATIAAARREITNPVRFAKAYGTGSVIQRDMPVEIWGYGGDNGDSIKVEIVNASGTAVKTGTAVSDGEKWSVTLDAVSGGHDVYSIKATDLSDTNNTAEITDVLFGDIFIASGQSNMEMTLGNTVNQLSNAGAAEAQRIINEANEGNKEIRFYNQNNVLSAMMPLEDAYTGKWTVGDSYDDVSGNSAIAYFFAQKLYSELGKEIPIGVISARRGGTKIKAWIPEGAYTAEYDDLTDYNRSNYYSYRVWTGEWNAQLAPLTCLNVKGVLWYQGEDDTDIPETYKEYFRIMKEGWRDEFGNKDMSFNIVQLAAFGANTGKYPAMRQTQLQLWQKYADDNVNMVTAIDVGNQTDIHPIYKAPVGNRLAQTVAANVYGKDIEYSGPLFEKIKAKDGKVVISFTHADGLKAQTRSTEYTEEFAASSAINCLEVTTDGTEWHSAEGIISGNTIEITGDNIVGVRYAWADYPVNPNLYNSSNLPAVPFMAMLNTHNAAPTIVVEGTHATVTLAYKNGDTLNLAAKLIIGKYNNSEDVLIGCEIKDINVVLNETGEYSFTVDLDGAEKVSTILVDGLDTLRPLTEKGNQ